MKNYVTKNDVAKFSQKWSRLWQWYVCKCRARFQVWLVTVLKGKTFFVFIFPYLFASLWLFKFWNLYSHPHCEIHPDILHVSNSLAKHRSAKSHSRLHRSWDFENETLSVILRWFNHPSIFKPRIRHTGSQGWQRDKQPFTLTWLNQNYWFNMHENTQSSVLRSPLWV